MNRRRSDGLRLEWLILGGLLIFLFTLGLLVRAAWEGSVGGALWAGVLTGLNWDALLSMSRSYLQIKRRQSQIEMIKRMNEHWDKRRALGDYKEHDEEDPE